MKLLKFLIFWSAHVLAGPVFLKEEENLYEAIKDVSRIFYDKKSKNIHNIEKRTQYLLFQMVEKENILDSGEAEVILDSGTQKWEHVLDLAGRILRDIISSQWM